MGMKTIGPVILGIYASLGLFVAVGARQISENFEKEILKNAAASSLIGTENETFSVFQAARVYGKFGCGDYKLAVQTAKTARAVCISPTIIAAKVARESSCNPYAISNKGAVGLAQIHVKTWAGTYDFSKVNLFNPEDNLRVGAEILAKMLKDSKGDMKVALARYNGTGEGTREYADSVMKLAGAR